MARKKKVEIGEEVLNVYNDERLVSKKDKEQLANKPAKGWPKITQGSHLTVKTFEDGRTELIWDHDALMRDVQEAIASVSTNIVEATETKVKKTRKKKADATSKQES